MTPDGHFLVDRMPGVTGFYVVERVQRRRALDLPAARRGPRRLDRRRAAARPATLEPFRLDRFDGRYRNDEELRAACVATYTHKYDEEEVAGMSDSTSVGDGGGAAVAGAQVPIFSRNATGLVRQVSLPQQIVFNLASSNALGLGLVFFLSVVVLFPRANIYVALLIAGVGSFFVWTTFALLSSAIPRVGGDYTINSRVMPPWLALGGNIGSFMGGLLRRPDLRLLHGDAGALAGARGDRRSRRLDTLTRWSIVLQQRRTRTSSSSRRSRSSRWSACSPTSARAS